MAYDFHFLHKSQIFKIPMITKGTGKKEEGKPPVLNEFLFVKDHNCASIQIIDRNVEQDCSKWGHLALSKTSFQMNSDPLINTAVVNMPSMPV